MFVLNAEINCLVFYLLLQINGALEIASPFETRYLPLHQLTRTLQIPVVLNLHWSVYPCTILSAAPFSPEFWKIIAQIISRNQCSSMEIMQLNAINIVIFATNWLIIGTDFLIEQNLAACSIGAHHNQTCQLMVVWLMVQNLHWRLIKIVWLGAFRYSIPKLIEVEQTG